MTRRFTFFSVFIILFFSVALTSCMKFEGEQTVPSYIRVDTFNLTCDYYAYGANTHNFIDAKIFVDEDEKGCFELPATIPVLAHGTHRVRIYPGIAVNGIKSTRESYPFVKWAEYTSVNLVPDSIVTLNPTVTYDNDYAHVRWMEDFDSGTITMETTSQSDVPFIRVGDSLAWHDSEGHSTYSAKFVLNSDTAQFYYKTTEEFADLSEVNECMLEMDYKCSDTCNVGLFYLLNYTLYQESIIRLRPTGDSGVEPKEWKKIYVNLGPYFNNDYKDADYFQIYFSS